MERLTAELGRVLRRARVRRGLTLRQMEAASGGRFKPSSIAGYERGERSISVERFCRLASFYGEDPGRLLTEALEATARPDSGVLIDLTRLVVVLSDLGEDERRVLERYLEDRGVSREEPSATVRLELEDLESLAAQAGRTPQQLLQDLGGAIRS
jgi:transcriptional regulator with XRE-family HTH domain